MNFICWDHKLPETVDGAGEASLVEPAKKAQRKARRLAG